MELSNAGEYQADYNSGRKCADRLIKRLKHREVTPFYLADMAERRVGGIGALERGFLAEISMQLMKL